MKKIIEMPVTRKETTAVEVEFPVYSKHDLMLDDTDCIYFYQLDENMRLVTVQRNIQKSTVHYSIEVEEHSQLTGDMDYTLGRGKFACTAGEFNQALADAIEFATQAVAGPIISESPPANTSLGPAPDAHGWQVLVEDAQIDYSLQVDVRLKNGRTEPRCDGRYVNWTQVRSWRYSTCGLQEPQDINQDTTDTGDQS